MCQNTMLRPKICLYSNRMYLWIKLRQSLDVWLKWKVFESTFWLFDFGCKGNSSLTTTPTSGSLLGLLCHDEIQQFRHFLGLFVWTKGPNFEFLSKKKNKCKFADWQKVWMIFQIILTGWWFFSNHREVPGLLFLIILIFIYFILFIYNFFFFFLAKKLRSNFTCAYYASYEKHIYNMAAPFLYRWTKCRTFGILWFFGSLYNVSFFLFTCWTGNIHFELATLRSGSNPHLKTCTFRLTSQKFFIWTNLGWSKLPENVRPSQELIWSPFGASDWLVPVFAYSKQRK